MVLRYHLEIQNQRIRALYKRCDFQFIGHCQLVIDRFTKINVIPLKQPLNHHLCHEAFYWLHCKRMIAKITQVE